MAAWDTRRDTRDPCQVLMDREAHDCQLTKCAHFQTIFDRRWCEIREQQNPFNRNCQYFKKG